MWNDDDLKKIEIRRNDGTNYLMNASDTLSEKLNGFDMSASVKLGIMSGLIELGGGSAAYLTKQKYTRGECSVQVKCFYKTGYKEMGMDQLTNIRYPDVARTGHNNTATHFVMKIQYGAGAIFTFTKQFESRVEEEQVKAKAELNICGQKILSVLDGSVEGNYRNYSSNSQIKCEFKSFGLSLREALPTTFNEAVRFAGNFGRMAHQSMARHRGEALGIPCIVWLKPLVALPGCANAPKLHCDFTPDQACKLIKFFEDCDKLKRDLAMKLVSIPIEARRFGIERREREAASVFSFLVPSFSFPFRLVDLTDHAEIEAQVNKCKREIQSVNGFRSKSTQKLREVLVEIRSGTITSPLIYLEQVTQSLANHLDAKIQIMNPTNVKK